MLANGERRRLPFILADFRRYVDHAELSRRTASQPPTCIGNDSSPIRKAGRPASGILIQDRWEGARKDELTHELVDELTRERTYERWTSVYECLRAFGGKNFRVGMSATWWLQAVAGTGVYNLYNIYLK